MDIEIDLSMLFGILRKRFLVIVLAMLICAGAGFACAEFLITPQYTSTVKLYVYSDPDRTTTTVTNSELTASQSLVDTYIVVLESDTVMDAVIEELELNYTASQLRAKLTSSVINETEVFSVSVTDSNRYLAQKIANAIAEVAPDEIVRVVKAGGVEVVDYATLPSAPSSPSVSRFTILGALIGFVLSYGTALLRVCLDTKIHDESDLASVTTIPLLGSVPTFESSTPQKEVRHHGAEA